MKSPVLNKLSKTTLVFSKFLFLMVVTLFCAKVFICDRFIVNGNSMYPTYYSGCSVYVNKLIMGGRIYTKFDFKDPVLHSIRVPGFRKVKVGDVVVFNYPYGQTEDSISFKINYVFTKRCVACPGDTILIKDCRFVNSRTKQIGIPETSIAQLISFSDSLLIQTYCLFAGHFAGEQNKWTIKNLGPIWVPQKGVKVKLDSTMIQHYGRLIRYEGGSPTVGSYYTFRKNYYFLVGDNLTDSYDSRYIGFIPEPYIIGVVAKNKFLN